MKLSVLDRNQVTVSLQFLGYCPVEKFSVEKNWNLDPNLWRGIQKATLVMGIEQATY